MGYFTQNVGGGKCGKLLKLANPFHHDLAIRAENWVRSKVVNQDIGIQEYGRIGRNLDEVHGLSRIPNSGSSATRRTVSASPVQPMIPYDFCTRSFSAAT